MEIFLMYCIEEYRMGITEMFIIWTDICFESIEIFD